MSGYRADLDAITAAAGVLRTTLDSVTAAHDQFGHDLGSLGPGRLDAAVARLSADARRDLDGIRQAVSRDASLVNEAARHYADTDTAAAALLIRRADG
jgi:hypothetical protein